MSTFSPRSSLTTMRTRDAAGADAGADRVDVGVVGPRPRSSCGGPGSRAMALISTTPLDDLGHLELEQPLDQAGVGAADTTICGPLVVLRTSTM